MSSTPTPTHYNQIDTSKVKVKSISEFKMGFDVCKKIEVSYDGWVMCFTTPKMEVPMGVSQYPPADTCTPQSSIKYHMNHTFSGIKDGFESNPKVGEFHGILMDLDIRITELLLERSGDILSEPTSEYSIMDQIYGRIVQVPKTDERDPFCKVKVPTMYNNKFVMKSHVFGSNDPNTKRSNDVREHQEYMRNHKWVKSALKFQYLYYINGTIYPSIELYQQKVYESKQERPDLNGDEGANSKGKRKKSNTQEDDEFL